MFSPIPKVDATGSFYASAVIRPGKTEVQIFPLLEESENVSVNNTLNSVFEIEGAETLVSLEWVTKDDVANGKKAKRRQSNGPANGTVSLSYLACALQSGRVLIFSPFQQDCVNEFDAGSEIFACSSIKNTLWVSTKSEIVEYELNAAKAKTTVQYPKSVKNVSHVKAIHVGSETQIIVLGDKTYVLNTSGDLLHTFTAKSQVSILMNDKIVISKDKEIIMYNVQSYKKAQTFKLSQSITALHQITENYLSALTSSGSVQLIQLSTQKVVSITAKNKKVHFTNAFAKGDRLVIAYTDLLPEFVSFELEHCTSDISVDVKHTGKQSKVTKTTEAVVAELEIVEEYNVRDSKLALLIQENLENDVELLKILNSNPQEDKIKTIVASLPVDMALKVYDALSSRVQSDPTESATLNNWLKWLVVNHNAAINQNNNIKPLMASVSKSLKQFPNLLALQGRLELLQSQLQLRIQTAAAEKSEQDVIAQAEESIVYVNGENDDGDSEGVLEAAGNSESEPES